MTFPYLSPEDPLCSTVSRTLFPDAAKGTAALSFRPGLVLGIDPEMCGQITTALRPLSSGQRLLGARPRAPRQATDSTFAENCCASQTRIQIRRAEPEDSVTHQFRIVFGMPRNPMEWAMIYTPCRGDAPVRSLGGLNGGCGLERMQR